MQGKGTYTGCGLITSFFVLQSSNSTRLSIPLLPPWQRGRIRSLLTRLCSLKTFNWSHSSSTNTAKVLTYLKQSTVLQHTRIQAILSQRGYNPKKRKRKAPFYRSGLTRFGSRLQRIYVAKELNLHVLSPSFHWSDCNSSLQYHVHHTENCIWVPARDTGYEHRVRATYSLRDTLPASICSE